MSADALVKRCPACGAEHPPTAMRCDCGVLLAGVDLTPGSVAAAPAAPQAVAPDAAPSVLCPHADCGQPNPTGRDRCIYCDRPLAAPAQFTLYWPWGARTPVGASLAIGRVAPTPPALIAEIERAYDNVSRRHARLACAGGELSVEDLGSTNGTFVDDVRIPAHTPVRLIAGVTVRFAADLQALVEEGVPSDGERRDAL